jgi:membrane protease YdiL (CAAX protease family)
MQNIFLSFLILLLSILLGILLGNLSVLLLAEITDQDLTNILNVSAQCSLQERIFLRSVNALNHLFTFSLAPLAAAYFLFRKAWWQELGWVERLKGSYLLIAIVFISVSFPFAQLLYGINQAIPMPDWAFKAERETEKLLFCILQMDSPLELVANLFVIAILPAFGEEVLFRGFIQKRLAHHLPVWASITLTAFLFSAVHFQFEGFLARFLLGGILGFVFHKTQNLWVPIATHLFFNGLQVLVYYFFGEQAINQEVPDIQTMLLPGLISLFLMILFGYFWKKKTNYVD